ncbi:MAG: DUF4406 domain-containing protein [Lachnospiraceae bacterium]
MVYIASPLRGNYDENIKKAVEYCKTASELGVIPLAPHIIFSQWCNDTIAKEREKGLELGLNLLSKVDEMWVMGEEISEGMRGEIAFAKENGIPAHHIKNPMDLEKYPISTDEYSLLGKFQTIDEADSISFENQFVILDHSKLKEECRNSLNQLWVATHGPGCRGGSFTGTVHLTHPIDGDTMAVARSDILGIAKPEVIAHLYYQYGLSLDEEIDMEAIKDEDMSL